MSFLPESYEPPASGNYLKLQPGDNRIRAMSSAVVGNLFWRTDEQAKRHPVRRRMNEVIRPDELEADRFGKKERPKHFWTFAVWDYKTKQIMLLEITQRTVQMGVLALCQTEDWGDPKGYDLIIQKSGSDMETRYAVLPGKASPPSDDALREMQRVKPNLEALFDGADPFADAGLENDAASTDYAGEAPGVAITRIHGVTAKRNAAGSTVWLLTTDHGEYGTTDPHVGDIASKLTGAIARIPWHPNDKGGRVADSVESWNKSTPAEYPKPDPADDVILEDDIPF